MKTHSSHCVRLFKLCRLSGSQHFLEFFRTLSFSTLSSNKMEIHAGLIVPEVLCAALSTKPPPGC